MRIQATSPGKKFDIKERISVLKLTAENVGEAIELATVLAFIEAEGITALSELAIERPFSTPGDEPARKGR